MQNRIRELREEKKMTQIRLSIELEVAQETISAYENGRHYPSVASLLKMAILFNSSMDYIMGVSEIRLPVKEDALSQKEATALSLFRDLSENQKEKVLGFMQGMLG